MKNGKYYIRALGAMLISVCFALSGCDTANKKEAYDKQDNTSEVINDTGVLSEIKERGVLRIGSAGDYRPMSYYSRNRQI